MNFKSIKYKDVFIVVLILITSFGYYLSRLIPEHKMEIDLFLFKVGNSGFYDVRSMLHFIEMKMVIIVFSSLWYITCCHWWKSSILVIITIELLKLMSTFNPNQSYFDEIEFYTSLPITTPIILLLVYFSNRLNKYSLAKEVHSQIDCKIDEVFSEIHTRKRTKLDDLERKFLELKSNKANKDCKKYLQELMVLRDECYND